jgi:hypothetical protein
MRCLLLCFCLLWADEPPENIAAYFKQRDSQAAVEIKRLDAEIRRVGALKKKSNLALIARWRKDRDALKKDASEFIPEIPYDRLIFKVGEIGRLSGGRAHPHATIKVANVIDEYNMLVDVSWRYDDLQEHRKYERRLWLRGFPTKNYANDLVIKLDDTVEVTGNQSYDTVSGGKNTVFVVESFDKARLEPWLKKRK